MTYKRVAVFDNRGEDLLQHLLSCISFIEQVTLLFSNSFVRQAALLFFFPLSLCVCVYVMVLIDPPCFVAFLSQLSSDAAYFSLLRGARARYGPDDRV